MAQFVIRDIATTVGSSGFYTLMADEVTDASNIEQVLFVLEVLMITLMHMKILLECMLLNLLRQIYWCRY